MSCSDDSRGPCHSRRQAMDDRHQEIEVKLRIDPDKMSRIRRSRWWRQIGPGRRQSLHSIYFDTDDRRLRDSDISLRTRTDGHEFVQTVKMLNGSSISRGEWEAF